MHDIGDIVWVDFDPVRGTEQAKRRPALVLTTEAYHRRSTRAVVCPITSNPHPWTFNVSLPGGLKTQGVLQVDQVRIIDRTERILKTVERAPIEVVDAVRAKLAALLGIGANFVLGE